jgi:LysM repeat protein
MAWGVNPPAGYPNYNPANGEYYKIVGASGGVWHEYRDGHKVFVATPQPVTPSGGTAAPAPPPIPPAVVSSTPQPVTGSGKPEGPAAGSTGGTLAPAPAPTPTPNTGGTPAPAPSGGGGWEHIPPALQQPSQTPTPAPNTGGTLAPSPTPPSLSSVTGGTPAPASSSASSATTSGGTGGTAAPASDSSTPANTDSSAASGGPAHTVVHGDTMWGIAQANGVPLSKLESLNPQIKNPELIFPGQQVNLGSTASAPAGGSTATDSSVAFPKTSSYQTSGSASQPDTTVTKSSGWGATGTGAVPADPAKGIIEVVTHQGTDPLKINENKGHSA